MREDVNEGRAYDETELQPTEIDSGSLVRRAGARAAVGHLDHHHSDGELAATPRRTGAVRNQKKTVVVITSDLLI